MALMDFHHLWSFAFQVLIFLPHFATINSHGTLSGWATCFNCCRIDLAKQSAKHAWASSQTLSFVFENAGQFFFWMPEHSATLGSNLNDHLHHINKWVKWWEQCLPHNQICVFLFKLFLSLICNSLILPLCCPKEWWQLKKRQFRLSRPNDNFSSWTPNSTHLLSNVSPNVFGGTIALIFYASCFLKSFSNFKFSWAWNKTKTHNLLIERCCSYFGRQMFAVHLLWSRFVVTTWLFCCGRNGSINHHWHRSCQKQQHQVAAAKQIWNSRMLSILELVHLSQCQLRHINQCTGSVFQTLITFENEVGHLHCVKPPRHVTCNQVCMPVNNSVELVWMSQCFSFHQSTLPLLPFSIVSSLCSPVSMIVRFVGHQNCALGVSLCLIFQLSHLFLFFCRETNSICCRKMIIKANVIQCDVINPFDVRLMTHILCWWCFPFWNNREMHTALLPRTGPKWPLLPPLSLSTVANELNEWCADRHPSHLAVDVCIVVKCGSTQKTHQQVKWKF